MSSESQGGIRIVFMGTAKFAIPSLTKLQEAPDVEVVGVVTSVDKLGGRGQRNVIESAVKKFASRHIIPVLQPKNLKALEFREDLLSLRPDLFVVVAFRMLPEIVWSLPAKGTINLHASLLPAYRGAAPINWAIVKGEKTTGLTTFFIDEQIDTGNIIMQTEVPIRDSDTAGTLHDRMMYLGGELVLQTVRAIDRNDFQVTQQDRTKVSKAPKIFRKDCEIDFSSSSWAVYNFIRGMSPYPGAWTTLDGMTIKILSATIIEKETNSILPGKWESDGRSYIHIGTANGGISLKEVQLEGRKRMPVKTFLNGFDITTLDSVLTR